MYIKSIYLYYGIQSMVFWYYKIRYLGRRFTRNLLSENRQNCLVINH